MSRHPRLWIVVADGEHARFVAPRSPVGTLHTTTELESPSAGDQSSDLGSDRPGRTHESLGPTRHAIAPKHDPHEQAKQAFLKSVAARIDEAAVRKEFDSLLLVAPGHAQATLREALAAPTKAMVVGTLVKDLTKVPDHDLREHVAEFL